MHRHCGTNNRGIYEAKTIAEIERSRMRRFKKQQKEKGRDLTLSYDKSSYTNRMFKKAK